MFGVPLALTGGIFLLSFVPHIQATPLLARSFWGAALALLLWHAALILRARRASEQPALRIDGAAASGQEGDTPR